MKILECRALVEKYTFPNSAEHKPQLGDDNKTQPKSYY